MKEKSGDLPFFKPGDLSRGDILFFKIFFPVGISLPILLWGYGLLQYFTGEFR